MKRLLMGGLAVGLTTLVVPVAHATTAAAPSTVRLANTVVPNLARATMVGTVPGSQRIQVTVGLAHPNPAGERALEQAMYDKSSPAYHRFLTPAQYASRFGVDAAEYSKVTDWLTRDGMTVGYANPTRTQVLVEGTVAQAEKTFDVTLNNYTVGGRRFRANPAPALAPTGVDAILGLQTVSNYVLPKDTETKPANDICIVECVGSFTPQDLWKAYHLPSTDKGMGVRTAVIGEGETSTVISALHKFELADGLRTVPTRSVFVSNDKSDNTGDGEWEIDSQAITGMAPDLEQLVFYMSQDLASVSNSISAWVNDTAGPSIADMSIGGCETLNLALGTPLVEEPLLQQGALEGRSLFVSTGDTGGSCLFSPLVNTNGVENTGVPNPQWPSTSEAVVGVGGTVLYTSPSTGERTLEYTWTHGGGGTSSFIPAPDWQKPITLIKAPCTTDYTLSPVSGYVPCRGVPDVSALSGDILTNGYATYDQTGTQTIGAGTSLASPLWAGMWARVQAASSTPLGLATPLIYNLETGGTLDALTDISVGSNVQWTAQPRTPANPTGWDFTNGLGVAVGDKLTTDIAGSTTTVATSDASLSDTTETQTAAGANPCVGTGSYADPRGDVVPFPADVDLTGATIGDVGSNLVFTSTVSNLSATPLAKEYDWDFNAGTAHFEVEGVLGVGKVMTTAHLVDASFNDLGGSLTVSTSGNTVTVSIPLSSFDAATGLSAGATLSGVTMNADIIAGPGATPADLPFIIDQLDATSCGNVTA
ncbi:MAG: pseudomonalisin [Frankiaceae bacterium]|nr:pseudomonalisin [Frankiaceae bacterium]